MCQYGIIVLNLCRGEGENRRIQCTGAILFSIIHFLGLSCAGLHSCSRYATAGREGLVADNRMVIVGLLLLILLRVLQH
jgi:hypothetical protein